MNSGEYMDFHDGLVERIEVDPVLGALSIYLSAFQNEQAKERTRFILDFSGVSYFALVADLGELKRNSFAGTIISAREDPKRVTHIYLTGGILTIRSKSRTIRGTAEKDS